MRIVSSTDIPESGPPNEERLRSAFAAPSPPTVGIEEELMLLDPATLDLAPRAEEVIAALDGDRRYALELPASQIEIVGAPSETVGDAIVDLARARRHLAAGTEGFVRVAGAGLHPFAAVDGTLNRSPRYDVTIAEHGYVAARQLVFALQVHVAIRGADRALAVHNALRSHLPELAALAANAPFHGGRDTGLASARPTISRLLPRQGVPPVLESWGAYARALELVGDPSRWWWELRPHPLHGTLEVRVPDTQATVADAGAVAAVAQCLCVRLAERHDAGEALPADETWRIEENRWRAARYGVEGDLLDLRTGELLPVRRRLHGLLDELEPVAERLRCSVELASARRLVERNGATRLRAAAGSVPDLRKATEWLANSFLADLR
jgi:carboxylate-amine ligase